MEVLEERSALALVEFQHPEELQPTLATAETQIVMTVRLRPYLIVIPVMIMVAPSMVFNPTTVQVAAVIA